MIKYEYDLQINDSLNGLNENFNTVSSNLTSDIPFRFGKDSDGNYGYIITDEAGADTVIPFKKDEDIKGILAIKTTSTKSQNIQVIAIGINESRSTYASYVGEGGSFSTPVATLRFDYNIGYGWILTALTDLHGTYEMKAGETRQWLYYTDVSIIVYG